MAGNGRLIAISKSPTATATIIKTASLNGNGTNIVQQQQTGGPSGYLTVRQNLSSQTIDLTDEEEPKSTHKTYATNNPPALTSIANKTNSSQQYTITHQRMVQKSAPIGKSNKSKNFNLIVINRLIV